MPAPATAKAPLFALGSAKSPKLADTLRSSRAHAVASADPDQDGVLRVTADPRATIEVSGFGFHEIRQTPVLGLKVPSGKYQIVFRNDTFGAPVNAQVMVVAGASRSVHADFRQAEPVVTVR
jgi:hypothetical protein